MLIPVSSGTIGLSNGNQIRFGLRYNINPLLDSDHSMHDFLLNTEDIFGFLNEDEDVLPCVERVWKIKEFDEELANLCANAWLKMSIVIKDAFHVLGETLPPHDLNCRHSRGNYMVKLYSRDFWREILAGHK